MPTKDLPPSRHGRQAQKRQHTCNVFWEKASECTGKGGTSCRLRFLLDIVSIGGLTSSMTAASPVPLFSTRKVPVWFTVGLPTMMLPMLAFTCKQPQRHAGMQATKLGHRTVE